MKKFASLFLFLFSLSTWALELKVGDILLQPLDCWSCSLIEAQENTIYSHMGIVIQTSPTVLVAEAQGTVRSLSLDVFRSKNQKGQNLSVRRFRSDSAVRYLESMKRTFLEFYKNDFEGLKYDKEFLWNNIDETGREKLYCSEMITKLLQGFMRIELPIKRMKFDRNREAWIKYFQGNPPDGKWGNSPADFELSELFYEVGEL
jgi:hypothetical protein